MPKNRPTAAQRARRLQAANGGGVYTDVLHSLSTPASSTTSLRADTWLSTILSHLQELGWPAYLPDRDGGRYLAYCGPVQLDVSRDVDVIAAEANGADPDDPRWSSAPLYLGVQAPYDASDDDLNTGAQAGKESPAQIAERVDAELAEARRRQVCDADAESEMPCPICGDRYPERHLLANSPEADPTCPACIWDGDQPWRTDLPHLAVQIDRLLDYDLAAPAGWSAVAAALALTCGAALGRRLERELKRRGGWPFVMERWNQPLERSWIWLPPRETRHPAFAQLGAGASLAMIAGALERHDPTLRDQARRVCRDADVRWRPALWPTAVAYAVAFSTQAAERDRHRKPVHVVHSTSDGLSQIMAPFAVSGDVLNVESGLSELLEYLLFPLLLGHGLRDEPRGEQRRIYGAAQDDDRPARSRSDAHLSHELDRAGQVAVALGRIPGVANAEVMWDASPAEPVIDGTLGATSPVNDLIDELRQAARIQAAEQLYDSAGPMALTADEAWSRSGRWIPADDAPRALDQARRFLARRPKVRVLWAGPGGALAEPVWIRTQVAEINAHATDPGVDDAPWLQVFDGESLRRMRIADIAIIDRDDADTTADSNPAEAPETQPAYTIDPTAEQAWRLVGHNLHHLAHTRPRSWRAMDHMASKCRDRLWTLPTEHGQDVTVQMWLRLTDTEINCDDPDCQARSTYLASDGSGRQPASGPLPDFARTGGLAYFTFTTHPHHDGWATSCGSAICSWLYTALALYGGYLRVDWMDFADPDALSVGHGTWEVRDYQETEMRSGVITSGPGGISETNSGDPGYVGPNLPPDIAAALHERARARAEDQSQMAAAKPAT